MIHPIVQEKYQKWLQFHQEDSYTVKESALLFETNAYKYLDKIILISTPLPLRIKYIQKRDPHRKLKETKSIISQQLPEEKKLGMADFIIKNNGHQLILKQVLNLHKRLCSKME